MKLLIKYIATWIFISLISGAINYWLNISLTERITYPVNFKSILLTSSITSFTVHVFYIFFFKVILKDKNFNSFTKSMCCFVLVILFWIAIGSITFGFTVKNLLFIALSFGILNAMLPYFDKKLYTQTQNETNIEFKYCIKNRLA